MTMRTVLEAWQNIAREAGANDEETIRSYVRVRLATHLDPSLPSRYARLTTEVLFRLPEGWDDKRTWSVTPGRKQSPKGYAYALREEEGEGETEQLWSMTLLPSLLDKLSDSAVHWVIAHEFGHIASGLPTGSLGIEGTAHTRVKGTVDRYEPAPEKAIHEDAADSIALSWGFSEELHAFLREDR
jgi:hypothetical protein